MIEADEWLGTVSTIVFVGHFLLIGAAMAWLLPKSRFLTCGALMLAFAFIPVAWQGWFTTSEAKGAGLLLLFTVPPALLMILAGILTAGARAFHALRRKIQQPGL